LVGYASFFHESMLPMSVFSPLSCGKTEKQNFSPNLSTILLFLIVGLLGRCQSAQVGDERQDSTEPGKEVATPFGDKDMQGNCAQCEDGPKSIKGETPPPEQSKGPTSQVTIVPTAKSGSPKPLPPPERPKNPAGSPQSTTPPGDSRGLIRAEILEKDRWDSGYCADILIRNNSQKELKSWRIQLAPAEEIISQSWNLKVVKADKGYSLEPLHDFNKIIPAGASNKTQGFCASLHPSKRLHMDKIVVQ
jgi:hypothetical protein